MTLPVVTLPPPTPPGIANIKNGINGYLFCNGPTVRVCSSLQLQTASIRAGFLAHV